MITIDKTTVTHANGTPAGATPRIPQGLKRWQRFFIAEVVASYVIDKKKGRV